MEIIEEFMEVVVDIGIFVRFIVLFEFLLKLLDEILGC